MTTPPAATLEEALTPTWISAALSDLHPGVVVEDVELRELLHGVGTKALMRLTYAESGDGGLPRELCLKAGYEPHNQHLLEGGAYLKETRFYRDVARQLPVRVPECFYAGCDDVTNQGVLILENLHTTGGVLCSASREHTVDEAARFLDSFAALHASHWDGEVNDAHPWIGTRSVLDSVKFSAYTDRIQANLDDPRGATLTEEMRDGSKLIEAAARVSALIDHRRGCLVHGDPHAGNLYLTGSGEPGLYDWQTVQISSWAVDVPYYLCAALSHEDRRSSLPDLLRHYLGRLEAHGVTPPSWDEAWLSFRQFTIYGFYLWAITRPIVQPVEVINTFVDRLGAAASEAGAYEALGLS